MNAFNNGPDGNFNRYIDSTISKYFGRLVFPLITSIAAILLTALLNNIHGSLTDAHHEIAQTRTAIDQVKDGMAVTRQEVGVLQATVENNRTRADDRVNLMNEQIRMLVNKLEDLSTHHH